MGDFSPPLPRQRPSPEPQTSRGPRRQLPAAPASLSATLSPPPPHPRDVLVNVSLAGEVAAAAGAAGHVCELQLVLRPFYQLR